MNTFRQAPRPTTKQLGDDAEDQALTHLQEQGLQLEQLKLQKEKDSHPQLP